MIFTPSFKPNKILVIKLKKLGDVLCTTPSVRQLKQLYPESRITFLSEPLGAQVYEFSSYLEDVWILPRKPTTLEYLQMIVKVNRGKFNIIIDLHHHNKTALMAMFSGAKYKLGFTRENENVWSYNYTVSLTKQERLFVNRTHHQLKLTKLIGTNYDDDAIEFEIGEKLKKFGRNFRKEYNLGGNTIAFCVQSERLDAQVSIILWVEIGNYLISRGHKLLFIFGPGEREKAKVVFQQLDKKEDCIIDYPIPKVAETRAILEHCKMYVGNDGGNKHLAVAAGIPTIGLFYGDRPTVWTPSKPQHRFLQTKDNTNSFNDFAKMVDSYDESQQEFIKI